MNREIDREQDLHLGKYSWGSVIKCLIAIMLIYALLGWLLVSHPYAFYTARATDLNIQEFSLFMA